MEHRREIKMSTHKKRIVVLGGSFNPPTSAHLNLMIQAINELNADFGLFVPSSDNYVRRKMAKQSKDKIVYSELSRYQMLSALDDRWETHPIMINICEYGDDGCGHTYDTLIKIQSQYPEHEIVFILGSDKLTILPKWYKNDALLEQFHFAVIARKQSEQKALMHTIENHKKLKAFKSHFHILNSIGDSAEISSTLARELIVKKDWHTLAKIIPKDVLKLIWRVDIDDIDDFLIKHIKGITKGS